MQTGTLRSYDRPADRIRQHRQADLRPILVVEGPSDERLVRHAFAGKYVAFPVGGRKNALDVVEQLYDWKMVAVACLVDRDFDGHVAQAEQRRLPVFAYENADLEAMLTKWRAFHLLALELGSEEKINKFGGFDRIARKIEAVVVQVARLRAANTQEGWGLRFDAMNIADKVDRKTLAFNLKGYCDRLAQISPGALSSALLQDIASGAKPLEEMPSCPRGSSPYYRGRDFLAAAGVALRHLIGSCELAVSRSEHLEGVLRAIGTPMVEASQWGMDLASLIQAKAGGARIPTQQSAVVPADQATSRSHPSQTRFAPR